MRRQLPDREETWTPEDAEGVLDEAARSGETLAGFARRHGYTAARLYWWRKRLRGSEARALGAASTLSLVPATIVSEAAAVIRLRGDVTIELAAATPNAVAAIVAELARTLP